MAAECRVCLIAAMDRLWFDQIILFPEPSSSPSSEPPAQSLLHSSKDSSKTQEIYPHDEIISQETEDLEKETATDYEEKPRKLELNLVSTKGSSRYYSASPTSAHDKRSRNHRTLKKSSSCKSLMDLELEEVKGFMDLGFIFRRENMTKRMIHLVPGLYRISNNIGSFEEDERKEIIVTRPYLSEAWIMKPEYSPLLNMRIPAVSKGEDMKKHLKFWAHTVVASAIQEES